MQIQNTGFQYLVAENIHQLSLADRELLQKAWAVIPDAYAPYSKFHVAAAARLTNNVFVTATNQENASYPVGICAERVLLSAVSSLHPHTRIETMAISYQNQLNGKSDTPLFPCGICRQSLLEYERRQAQAIRLVVGGLTGPVLIIEQSAQLLPFGFSGDALKTTS